MEMMIFSETDTAEITDNEIVDKILQGNKEWFELLIERNNQTLYRVVRGYIKQEEEVRDVMQNTYLKVYEKLAQFRRESTFSTWLIRIGINEALMRLRYLQKKNNYISSVRADNEIDSAPSEIDFMNPEKHAIQQETHRFIEQAIDHLPEKYRIVYMLRAVEGMSTEETADHLELSEGNVKIRLHRAKEMLQQNLYNLSSDVEIFKFGGGYCEEMRVTVMEKIHNFHAGSSDQASSSINGVSNLQEIES